MCLASWITEVTDTHSGYVILIAFPGKNGYTKVPEYYICMYIAVFLTLEGYSYSGISPFFKQVC
jgi:hypothetical protein